MLELPLDLIDTFLSKMNEEGKEIIIIEDSWGNALSSIIVPMLFRDKEDEVFISLLDIKNLVVIGIPKLFLISPPRDVMSFIICGEPIFEGEGSLNSLTFYAPQIGNEFETFSLEELWPVSNKGMRTYKFNKESPYNQHISMLMNSLVIRNVLLIDINNYVYYESTDKHKGEIEDLAHSLNGIIAGLIKSFPII